MSPSRCARTRILDQSANLYKPERREFPGRALPTRSHLMPEIMMRPTVKFARETIFRQYAHVARVSGNFCSRREGIRRKRLDSAELNMLDSGNMFLSTMVICAKRTN